MSGLHLLSATRVRHWLKGGSSSPVVVDTPSGLFVVKLRGAGQGVTALVAEIIVAELAEQIGLPVPERALLEIPPELPSDNENDELLQLLGLSVGLNLGLRFLVGASDPRPEELRSIEDGFVARVLWLDGLVMNIDRTPSNPNVLLWKRQPWLIDHGAALPFAYQWSAVQEESPREPTDYRGHVFASRVSLLGERDAAFAQLLSRAQLRAAVAKVPDAFLRISGPDPDPERSREAYAAFLWKRLKAPRPFLAQEPPGGQRSK
ncbi:MAG TPA: HipA family kinase [Polyangiaceae bacterium]|nr:HipA family kinase [Polyangiaceae bacterium]